MTFDNPLLATLIASIATTGFCSSAIADETQPYSVGRRVEDSVVNAPEWERFESESLAVWLVDTCLGFFKTGDVQILSSEPISFDPVHGAYLYVDQKRARLHVFNWPFNEFGVLECRTTGSPKTRMTPHDVEEVARWVRQNLWPHKGWEGRVDIQPGSSISVRLHNKIDGVTIGLGVSSDSISITLRADYKGPPIVLE